MFDVDLRLECLRTWKVDGTRYLVARVVGDTAGRTNCFVRHQSLDQFSLEKNIHLTMVEKTHKHSNMQDKTMLTTSYISFRQKSTTLVTVTLSPFAKTSFANPLLYHEVYFLSFDFFCIYSV